MISLWDQRFVKLADEARSWTKGLDGPIDRGVGACLVHPDKRRMSLGYAGFPRGLVDTASRLVDSQFRSDFTMHAELNAILNAGCNVQGWTIYITEHCCTHCAAAIIQSGVRRVVCPKPNDRSNWLGSQLRAANALHEAKLVLDYYDKETLDV